MLLFIGCLQDDGTRPCTSLHSPALPQAFARGAVSLWLAHAERLHEGCVSSVRPGPLQPPATDQDGTGPPPAAATKIAVSCFQPPSGVSAWDVDSGSGGRVADGPERARRGQVHAGRSRPGERPGRSGAAVCPGFSPRVHWEPSLWLQPWDSEH